MGIDVSSERYREYIQTMRDSVDMGLVKIPECDFVGLVQVLDEIDRLDWYLSGLSLFVSKDYIDMELEDYETSLWQSVLGGVDPEEAERVWVESCVLYEAVQDEVIGSAVQKHFSLASIQTLLENYTVGVDANIQEEVIFEEDEFADTGDLAFETEIMGSRRRWVNLGK